MQMIVSVGSTSVIKSCSDDAAGIYAVSSDELVATLSTVESDEIEDIKVKALASPSFEKPEDGDPEMIASCPAIGTVSLMTADSDCMATACFGLTIVSVYQKRGSTKH